MTATARRKPRRNWTTGALTPLGRLGERTVRAVSLPQLSFLAEQDDIKETAERLTTIRTIRAGRDALERITKAQSFEAWKSIGAALAIGKTHALRVTGANRAWGQHYSREFGKWLKENGFDRMPKSTRSVAIELHENAEAIEAWRATLPERQRRRLVHPLSNVRRWRQSTATHEPVKKDLHRDALLHWRRFRACLEAMPPDEAISLWVSLSAELPTSHTARVRISVGTAVGMAQPQKVNLCSFNSLDMLREEG